MHQLLVRPLCFHDASPDCPSSAGGCLHVVQRTEWAVEWVAASSCARLLPRSAGLCAACVLACPAALRCCVALPCPTPACSRPAATRARAVGGAAQEHAAGCAAEGAAGAVPGQQRVQLGDASCCSCLGATCGGVLLRASIGQRMLLHLMGGRAWHPRCVSCACWCDRHGMAHCGRLYSACSILADAAMECAPCCAYCLPGLASKLQVTGCTGSQAAARLQRFI